MPNEEVKTEVVMKTTVLTKREFIALEMAKVLREKISCDAQELAKHAVQHTDALIEELERTGPREKAYLTNRG